MKHFKSDIPYAWFWLGKPLQRGYFRGERIRPVHIVTRDSSDSIQRCSREPSPCDKPTRSRCEVYNDQPRPSTSSSNERFECNSARKCNGSCNIVGYESESTQQMKRCSCSSGHKCPSPLQQGCLSPTPSSSRNVTPVGHYHHDCQTPSTHNAVIPCCQDHYYHSQHPASTPFPHQSVEVPRHKTPQARCTCKQSVPPAGADTHHHVCCCSEDCRLDSSSYVAMNFDDAYSETSVEAASSSERGADECRCGHLIFAIPVDCPGV